MPQAPSDEPRPLSEAKTQAVNGSLRIAPAHEGEAPTVLAFIRKLAEYEKLADEVLATEECLRIWLFGPHSVAEVILAYLDEVPVGFAIFFPNFSTFLGRPGLYLEDLFVEPAYRGAGIGRAILAYLATLTQERGYGRLEWAVLNWNQPAIDFYKGLGAVPMNDWTTFRLAGDALVRAGEQDQHQTRINGL